MDVKQRRVGGARAGGAAAPDAVQGAASVDPYSKHSVRTSNSSYSHRFWMVFAINGLIITSYGGRTCLMVASVGALASYLFDMIKQRELSFISFWATMIGLAFSAVIQSAELIVRNPFNMTLVYNMTSVIFLGAIYGTMQFDWVYDASPTSVVIMEKLLFAGLPFPSSVIMTWALAALNGAENIPFYLVLVMFGHIYLFTLPTQSAFFVSRGQAIAPTTGLVLSSKQTAVHYAAFTMLPAMTHIVMHRFSLFASMWDVATMTMVVTLPLVLLRTVSGYRPWMVMGSMEHALDELHSGMAAAGCAICMFAYEYRIVNHTLHGLNVLPPSVMHFLMVTATGWAGAMLWMHFAGAKIPSSLKWILVLSASVMGLVVAVIMHLPYILWISNALGASTAVLFYFDRSLPVFTVSSVCFTALFAWFMAYRMWFLDFEFYTITVQEFISIATILCFVALILGGLIIVQQSPTVTGVVFVLYTALLCGLEEVLYQHSPDIYPVYFIIFTSVAGLYMARKLIALQIIGEFATRLLYCLYASKMVILVTNVHHAMEFTLLLTVVAAYPVPRLPGLRDSNALRALVHVGAIAASVYLAEDVTYDVLMSTSGFTLTELNAVAFSVLLISLLSLRVTLRLMRPYPVANRLNIVIAALALVATVMDLESVTSGSPVAGMANTEPWLQGLLLAIAFFLFAMASGLVPKPRSDLTRLVHAVLLGGAVGLYVSGSFLPQSVPIQICYSAIFISCVAFMTLTFSANQATPLARLSFAVFIGLLPATYMLSSYIFAVRSKRLRNRIDVYEASRVILLDVYTILCLLLAFFVKAVLRDLVVDHHGARKQGSASAERRRAGSVRTSPEILWLSYLGNVVTLVAFGLCVYLSIEYLDGSDTWIFFFAPVLLLLNHEGGAFTVTDKSRYFPIVLVTSVFLILSSFFHCLMSYQPIRSMVVTAVGDWIVPRVDHGLAPLDLGKNLLMLFLVIPSHSTIITFVRDFKLTNDMGVLATIPLNLLPIIVADIPGIQLLGVVGTIGILGVWYVQRQMRRHGQYYL